MDKYVKENCEKTVQILSHLETFFFVATAFLIVAAMLYVLLSPHMICVSGNSMNPTYSDGDLLIGEKISSISSLSYQDVIVLTRPDFKAETIIKRIVGLPGDVIEISRQGIKRNGILLSDFPVTPTSDVREDYLIGENEVFVLGDNRDNSLDSRVFGAVDFKLVKYQITGYAKWQNNPLTGLLREWLTE